MAAKRSPQCDAVIARGRQLELKTQNEVLVFVFGQEVASLAWFADDGAVFNFITIDCSLPITQVLSVDQFDKSIRVARRKFTVRFLRCNFANENIPPANLTAVGLKLDRAGGIDRISHITIRQLALRFGFLRGVPVRNVPGFLIGEKMFE